MKTYFGATLAFTTLLLLSCQKKEEPPIIPDQDRPILAPTPTATPTPTPVPTPQARLAAPGTYYVIKHFSLRSEDGLYGFPIGKKVTLVREDILDLVVTDGIKEGKAPKDSFTNDLDVLDALCQQTTKVHQSVQQARTEQQQTQAQMQAAQNDAIAKDREERRKQQIAASISALRQQSAALSNRISVAANEREQKGFPRNGGSRRSSGQYKDHTTSLGTDASQIESLISAQARIESQIRELESKR